MQKKPGYWKSYCDDDGPGSRTIHYTCQNPEATIRLPFLNRSGQIVLVFLRQDDHAGRSFYIVPAQMVIPEYFLYLHTLVCEHIGKIA